MCTFICHETCLGCTGPAPNECIKCRTYLKQVGTRCEPCPDGYASSGGTEECRKLCHNTCADCDGFGPNNCTSCPDSSGFNSTDKSCRVCEGASYGFGGVSPCRDYCDVSCLTCERSDPTVCTYCKMNFRFDKTNKKCIECPPSEPGSGGLRESCTFDCHPSCKECSG